MFTVQLLPVVHPEYAENVARSLLSHSRGGENVCLDASATQAFQPGAVPRLGNAMRVITRGSLTVVVPSGRSADEPWIEELVRSGLGLHIAAHAAVIRTRNRRQTRTLREALAALPSGGRALHVRALNEWDVAASRSIGRVQTLVASYLDTFGTAGTATPSYVVEGVARLVAESIWNVLDHSGKRPLPDSEHVTSWLSVRRLEPDAMTLLVEGFPGEERSTVYFGDMRDRESPPKGYLEIVINDDGVGVAARQSLRSDIYAGSLGEERSDFAAALAEGGSVKLRARDCYVGKDPGFGSAYVASSLVTLDGFASIRSGRLLAYLDGTRHRIGEPAEFVLEDAERPYIPGTTLHVILPLGVASKANDSDCQASLF